MSDFHETFFRYDWRLYNNMVTQFTNVRVGWNICCFSVKPHASVTFSSPCISPFLPSFGHACITTTVFFTSLSVPHWDYNRNLVEWTVSGIRQLDASLSTWRPRFDPRPVYVGFLVERVAPWQVHLLVLWFSPASYQQWPIFIYIPLMLLVCSDWQCHYIKQFSHSVPMYWNTPYFPEVSVLLFPLLPGSYVGILFT
jgi:hypothetical protein